MFTTTSTRWLLIIYNYILATGSSLMLNLNAIDSLALPNYLVFFVCLSFVPDFPPLNLNHGAFRSLFSTGGKGQGLILLSLNASVLACPMRPRSLKK